MNPSMAYKSFWLFMCLWIPQLKTAFAGAEPKGDGLSESITSDPALVILYYFSVMCFLNISNLGFFAPKGNFSVSKKPRP
jgi:hypothetical protein